MLFLPWKYQPLSENGSYVWQFLQHFWKLVENWTKLKCEVFAEKHFHHFLVEKYLMFAPNSKIMLQLIKEISLFVSKHRKIF